MPVALATALAAMIANPAAPTLAEFEATLARHDSASLALEEWCGVRGMAEPARLTAKTLGVPGAPAPTQVRQRLALAAADALAMRHVQLSCGGTVLSVAWNWYAPARLTPAMNAALARGDTPFGKVVAPLGFRRKPLSTVAGPAENCPADTISTHRAMLVLPDGRPLAYLVECYTAANLR